MTTRKECFANEFKVRLYDLIPNGTLLCYVFFSSSINLLTIDSPGGWGRYSAEFYTGSLRLTFTLLYTIWTEKVSLSYTSN